ncbi:uncharacterized protein LOC130685867 isoform X2 [Daphnia carinata]|uniref:uncharacterized protein LOC130685867 isoform X2 n=1 Tax=Daphnia carinata TaxID=120202 RepID=UPI00257C8CC3|nr:uncharacterized protein LOC130685867 isoform X2 [Daphnia carinata]
MRPGNTSAAGNCHRSLGAGRKTVNVKTGLLRVFSVINIFIYSLCVGLEAVHPYVGQGIWGSSVHMMSGLVGFSGSYRPTKIRLSWVLAFSCLSIMFALIVSGLSWAGYTDCDHYHSEYDPDIDICIKPVSQLALMAVNIVALVFSLASVVVVARPLCCAPHQRQNPSGLPNINVSIIGSPRDTPSLSTGTTTITSSSIHTFPSHRPEREILARLALFSHRLEEEEDDERPPRYSIAIAEAAEQQAQS